MGDDAREYSASEVLSIVRTAGESGLRWPYIMSYDLTSVLSDQEFIELARLSGISGITSLYMGRESSVYELLSSKKFIAFAHTAANNGVRDLNFSSGELEYLFDREDFMNLIEFESSCSLKSLNLS